MCSEKGRRNNVAIDQTNCKEKKQQKLGPCQYINSGETYSRLSWPSITSNRKAGCGLEKVPSAYLQQQKKNQIEFTKRVLRWRGGLQLHAEFRLKSALHRRALVDWQNCNFAHSALTPQARKRSPSGSEFDCARLKQRVALRRCSHMTGPVRYHYNKRGVAVHVALQQRGDEPSSCIEKGRIGGRAAQRNAQRQLRIEKAAGRSKYGVNVGESRVVNGIQHVAVKGRCKSLDGSAEPVKTKLKQCVRLAGLQAPAVRVEDRIVSGNAGENVFDKTAVSGMEVGMGVGSSRLEAWRAVDIHGSQLEQLIIANACRHISIGT